MDIWAFGHIKKMGLLSEFSKNEKPFTKNVSASEAIKPDQKNFPAGPSEPCPVCGGEKFWIGAYELTWYCEVCSPPKFEAFVKSRHVAQDEGGYEFIEELQTWFGPVEHFNGYARRWRSYYRMTDGAHGMVQEGNEQEGMMTIDAFNGVP